MTNDTKFAYTDLPDKTALRAMLVDRPQPDGLDKVIKAGLIAGAKFKAHNILGSCNQSPKRLFASGIIENTPSLAKAAWQRRKDLGWTQKHLAKESGVSIQSISAFENCKPAAKLAHIFQILDALNLRLTIETRP